MPDEVNTEQPTQQEPSKQPDKQPAPDTPQGNTEATFTQADIDRIVGERAKRAEESGAKKLLEQLGFEDASQLQALVKAAKEREEAELSEVEKLNKQIERLQEEKAKAEKERLNAEQARVADRRNAAFKAAAKGAIDADVLLTWVESYKADALAATVDEHGTVDDKKMDALIKTLQSEKPALFGSRGAGSPSSTGGYLRNPDNEEVVKEAGDHLRGLINR